MLLAFACLCAAISYAQAVTLPTSKAETAAIITARGQLTDVPTVYIWMLDAESTTKKPVEYTGLLEDQITTYTYYMIKLDGSTEYDTKISDNNITIADQAVLLPNYTKSEKKSDQYRLARIKVVDSTGGMKQRDELTTIRGRGNSTWYCDKKAYRLKFPSKTKFLAKGDGTNEYANAKNWTLLANAADKSMLRNALTREVSLRLEEKTGVKALPFHPAYKFVDLVVNDVYMGTYQVSDHTQIHKGRIDIDDDNGWLLESITDNNYKEDVCISSGGYMVNIKNPEDTYLTDNVKNSISEYIANITQLGWKKDYSESTGQFHYVDMESAVAYLICNEITGNFDGAVSNYLYRDINEGDKLKLGPLWDFDIAYNNYLSHDLSEAFIYTNGKVEGGLVAPVKSIIENSPDFVALLVERWNQIYDNGNLITYLEGKVGEIADGLKNTSTLNYTSTDKGGAGWSLSVDMLNWGLKTYSSYDAAVDDVKWFLEKHIAWLNYAINALDDNYKVKSLTIDASSTYFSLWDYLGKICNVTLSNRTFTSGKWNPICLPFTLTYEQLKTTFGNDVQLLEYSGFLAGAMRFAAAPDTRLVAGMPYLLKFSGSNVENPSFSKVCVSCPAPATISYSANSEYSFKGTYTTTTIATDGKTYLLNGEQFVPNSSVSTITGLSAYVTGPASSSPVLLSGADFIFVDAGENTTAIEACLNQTADVTLSGRSLYKDTHWNTLCLPFSLSSLTGTPLEGARVKTLTGSKFSNGTLTLTFGDDLLAIEAGKPYLVKWESAGDPIESPTFKDVTLVSDAAGKVKTDEITFLGNYDPVTLKKNNTSVLYLGDADYLYYPSAKVTVNAFRAYFKLADGLTAGEKQEAPVRNFCLDFGESSTDGIGQIERDWMDASWYTIDGRRLNEQPTQKGIYIYNGRKIIIQ